jgi:hypothetical protein
MRGVVLFRPLRLFGGIDVYLWPVLVALVVTLFPYEWLSGVWPAFGSIFDPVFATTRAHLIGHTTLFFLLGLLVLLSVPLLQRRPLRYFALILLVALGQEALQALFKRHLPTAWDGLDLLLDLTGSALAFLLLWAWQRARQRLSLRAAR